MNLRHIASFVPRGSGNGACWKVRAVTKEYDAPVVSVVVPTCGRPELLARCLEALSRQTLDARLFEIILVDDSRTRHGPAVARNRGWRRARGGVIRSTRWVLVGRSEWLGGGLVLCKS